MGCLWLWTQAILSLSLFIIKLIEAYIYCEFITLTRHNEKEAISSVSRLRWSIYYTKIANCVFSDLKIIKLNQISSFDYRSYVNWPDLSKLVTLEPTTTVYNQSIYSNNFFVNSMLIIFQVVSWFIYGHALSSMLERNSFVKQKIYLTNSQQTKNTINSCLNKTKIKHVCKLSNYFILP